MFELYHRIQWLYKKFEVSLWLPSFALVSYTFLGAVIFQWMEKEVDVVIRENYRNQTSYALEQVFERMLEIRCHDELLRTSRSLQIEHAKQALFWFLDHLNLTEVIDERTDDTPWTFLGSMFYAGQLYTTIGYGYPITRTTGGRVASIFYILFGIPIFLIILKDMGRLLSKSLRKLYRNLRTSKRKIVETTPIRKIAIAKSMQNKIGGKEKDVVTEIAEEEKLEKEKFKHEYHDFPISIALSILVLWILFSASLFCLWERQWGFMTSVYFFFVSISTVGLGDIVFSNPDMMIYNFGLILVGLALLSMCFNLIQQALERLLSRLVDEYIEEIEKMAEIVANEDMCEEEAIPIEFKMTGNLLTLPMKRVTNETGLLADAKSWFAEKIANNLIASRLGEDPESSDNESSHEAELKDLETGTAAAMVSRGDSPIHSVQESRRSSIKHRRSRIQLRHGRPLFNTIRTLDRIKPAQGDFRAMVFSKFIQSDKLSRLVDEAPRPRMVTTSCQTDADESADNFRQKRGRQMRKDSCSSFSTVYTNSVAVNDDDSVVSAAYCDVKFDYSTEVSSPVSDMMKSSLSILKLDDDEPMLPSKLVSSFGIWNPTAGVWKSPPQLRIQTKLAAVHELPSPLPTVSPIPASSPLKKYSSANVLSPRWKSEDELDKDEENIQHIRTVCGLLPQDFDSRSVSSRSTMVDSGYDKSVQDDSKRMQTSMTTDSTSERF